MPLECLLCTQLLLEFSHGFSLAVSTQPCEGEPLLAKFSAVETEAQDRVLFVAELVRVDPGVLLSPS